jgi:hypothetical protein
MRPQDGMTSEEFWRLREENARLRAAGNALWKHEIENDSQPSEILQALLDNWRDAALAPAQPKEQCLCNDDSPNYCAKCTRELLARDPRLGVNPL